MNALLDRPKLLAFLAIGCLIVGVGNLASAALRIDYYDSDAEGRNIYVYQQARTRADVLFLGSSHVRDGIRPGVVARTLADKGLGEVRVANLYQRGANILVSQMVLRNALWTNGCPTVVVLGVSPGTMNRDRDWPENIVGRMTVGDLRLLFPDVFEIDRINSILATQLNGLRRLAEYSVGDHPSDAADLDRVRSLRRRTVNRRIRMKDLVLARRLYREKFWANFDISPLQTRALDEIVRMSRKCSAQLLLTRMPNFAMHSEQDLEAVDAPFARHMERYISRRNLPWVDYQNGPLAFDVTHFDDVAHLNFKGGSLVSHHLASEWLTPLLKARESGN